jgi:hypothetical protein
VFAEPTEYDCSWRFGGREAGFGIIDVTIALAILMVMLIPVDRLVVTTSRSIDNNRSSVEVANYVSGLLNQDAAAVAVQTSWSTGSNPGPATLGTLPLSTTAFPESIAGETYTVKQAFGWCAVNAVSTGGAWQGAGATTIAHEPEGYWAVVTVTLGSTFDYYGATEISVPESVYSSGAPTSTASCPAHA